MRPILISLLLLTFTASSVPAGNLIKKACLKAGRTGATRVMCSCIQDVADTRLKRKDQKLAAKFFKDPHKAQQIRQSDNTSHEAFWQRYKAFGVVAEETCAVDKS